MSRRIVRPLVLSCVIVFCLSGVALSQVPEGKQSPPAQTQPSIQMLPDLERLRSDLERLRFEVQQLHSQISTQDAAQERIQRYLGLVVAVVVIMSVFGILLQILGFRVEATIRNRSQEESTRQRASELELNNRYLQMFEAASKEAKEAQRRTDSLQEVGLKRAADTLQLINNLLAITERSTARAAGTEYGFLSRSIDDLDSECQKLIIDASRDDERDIVAKPQFIERVKVLTKSIESLDSQVTTYNESVPRQFVPTQGEDLAGARLEHGLTPGWNRLSLTGPCLFIRGLNNHLEQNFRSAIDDWRSSLTAKGSSAVEVDANYWIGYVNDTLGNFEEAAIYLDAAARVAPDQRKVELKRLALETRFFDLDFEEVPKQLLEDGKQFFDTVNFHQVSRRSISSFATTMGNISMIQRIRDSTKAAEWTLIDSDRWYEIALKAESRSRWARFGKCINQFLMRGRLDTDAQEAARDVIDSVNREYRNRVEPRSKALSKVTEYMCMIMLGLNDPGRMSTIEGHIEDRASEVTARTIYSQFRKQNVHKDVFWNEFEYLRKTMNLRETYQWANDKERQQVERTSAGTPKITAEERELSLAMVEEGRSGN